MKLAWAFILACCLAVVGTAYGNATWPAALLEGGPVHFTDRDETSQARSTRLAGVASAIRQATRGDTEIAKALVVYGRAETHFARYVGEGRCSEGPKGSRCDEGKARTYWQLWEQTCPAAWAEVQGSQAELVAAAVCAARLMRSGWAKCRTIEGMFAATWGHGRCTAPGAAKRAEMFRRLR